MQKLYLRSLGCRVFGIELKPIGMIRISIPFYTLMRSIGIFILGRMDEEGEYFDTISKFVTGYPHNPVSNHILKCVF